MVALVALTVVVTGVLTITTVITWLNTAGTIILVPKIDAAAIRT